MIKYALAYALLLVTFLVIDGIWLTLIAKGFYRTHLGFLLADKPNLWAAAAFYFIFTLALMVFVIVPTLNDTNAIRAMVLGAVFGLVTYATYDLTNHTTVKNWPWIVTLVDLCWGMALTS